MPSDPRLALFIDLENIAVGVTEAKLPSFDINVVLERLVEKGKIVVKKAYADWTVYKKYKKPLHEAGIELIDIPQRRYSGKNSADIKMVVDAMDLCYSKDHVNFFVLVSGDSDFAPLVAKLKENDKTVVGLGLRQSTSDLLAAACDEFIFYDDLAQKSSQLSQRLNKLPKDKQKPFEMFIDAMEALRREDKEVLWSSMIKQTIKRKQPSFSETTYGYSSFNDLVKDGANRGLFKITKDDRSGSFVVSEIDRGKA